MKRKQGTRTLRHVIEEALPARIEPKERERRTQILDLNIRRWRDGAFGANNPEVKARKARERALAPIADDLREKLGDIAKELESNASHLLRDKLREALAAPPLPDGQPRLDGFDAAIDLYLIVCAALMRLQRWNKRWPRTPEGSPRTEAVDLAAFLQLLCPPGLSKKEFDDFLGHISGVGGLPEMNVEALRSRERRRSK